jgi:hypothetical protein
MMSHIIIHIRAIPSHQTSGINLDAKEELNIPNMDIMCTVWIAVHNKSMEIKPLAKQKLQ